MNKLLLAIAVLIAAVNVFSWSEAPVEKTNRGFDVSEILIEDNWQEAAPIFLADNFESLTVSNV